MDISQYIGTFVSEAQEHLDSLNECLLLLEKDPTDAEIINKIFRSFHTLKGNAATMGFVKYSELAHSLEDLLSKIRDGELKVDKTVIDLILEGCDLLETSLEDISNTSQDNIESEGVLNELQKYLDTEAPPAEVVIGEIAELSEKEKGVAEDLKGQGLELYRIIIVFEKDNPLKNAKALVILRELARISNMIKTTPEIDHISTGQFQTDIELVIASKENKDTISKLIDKISGIRHIFILGMDEKYAKPEETMHEEKEKEKAAIADEHKANVIKQIQGVKVDMERLDKLMNLVGELLIHNIRLQDIDTKKDYKSLKKVIEMIDRLTLDLQDEVMLIRMVPIGNIFRRFPRMVRDLAMKEGKDIDIEIEGQEITFDRTVLDQIGEPLVHLLRNCVDHGIEDPKERRAAGKRPQGKVKLIARREKNSAIIEVVDDGRGIDPNAVKRSCIKKHILTEAEASKMSDYELQMMVFRPSVSTNTIVTDVSGRGVGMDVVMSKIKELGGKIKMESTVGSGTTVTMQLPLTLAIITTLLVRIKDEIYAVPLSSIDRTVEIDAKKIKSIQGNKVFILRDKEIPLLWLEELTGNRVAEKKEKLTVLIVNKDNNLVGLVVDSILSQQQVLIKGLDDMVKGTRGVSGATILGDGSVAMILDIGTLI